ncbi:MAG: double-stranded uracil-DNA glycosylase [Blastocatellia bacterium]|jgi:TDG/mug DNA glycosylase family protein|nr:double-stranded uracil-DNA glycosylase [Blastocatellia bacterium]
MATALLKPDTRVKPTRAELVACAGKSIRDVIAADLRVLFCGINPGLYSGWTGHHFAKPGNRFWPALYASGFTNRLLLPSEKHELLKSGYGITNVIARTSASETDLKRDEYAIGARRLQAKLHKYRPAFLAVLGIGAYRLAFEKPKAMLGRQEEKFGDTAVWVLPNPSGLNAHYQAKELARLFRELREAVESECRT